MKRDENFIDATTRMFHYVGYLVKFTETESGTEVPRGRAEGGGGVGVERGGVSAGDDAKAFGCRWR